MLESRMGPGLAAVAGVVDAVADGDAVARPRLAGADPDVLGVGGIDGNGPWGTLVQGIDGDLYGTTTVDNGGTVFKLTPSGKLTTIYQFCSGGKCSGGTLPLAGLLLATNGNFFGTTAFGGTGGGTIFELTPGGKLTTIYSFPAQLMTDPQEPYGGLIQGPNGNFYGTTRIGGTYG